jgi:hypothetical protein
MITSGRLAGHQAVALQPLQLPGERGRLDPQHRGQAALDHRPVRGEHAQRHVTGEGRASPCWTVTGVPPAADIPLHRTRVSPAAADRMA